MGQVDRTPVLQGSTDGSLIGNAGDRLNVQTNFTSPNIDAFGKLRVASSLNLFSYHHAYSNLNFVFNEATTGTASSSHSNILSSLVMTVGTANGDSIIRQTRQYARYIPGKSAFTTIALVPGAPKTNVRRRWGSFDSDSGMFFQLLDSTLSVNVRQYLSGSAVDISIPQSSWNLDTLDGTGSSGITLSLTSHNVYVIDFSWHGSGLIRFGIVYNGQIVYCHAIQASNTYAGPYSRYPAHPVRLELTNVGATASSTSLQFTACSANKEGSEQIDAPYIFSASTENTQVTFSTRRPVLSLRVNPTFNGVANRIILQPYSFSLFSVQNAAYMQVVVNGTLTGASWTNINGAPTNAFSSGQKDVSATAITGGTVIYEDFVSGGGKGAYLQINSESPTILATNIAATGSDIITIVAQPFGGNTDFSGAIAFKEYQ